MIATFACSASRASKGVAALRHLEVSGIPAIAFKGLASMARLYPSPASEPLKMQTFWSTGSICKQLSKAYRIWDSSLENHALERLETFLDHSPGFSGNKVIVLYGPGDFELDLHWAVGVSGPGTGGAAGAKRDGHLIRDTCAGCQF